MKMSTRVLVISCFVLIAVLILGMGIISYSGFTRTKSNIKTLVQEDALLDRRTHKVKTLMLQHRRYEKDIFLNIGNPEKQKDKYLPSLKAKADSIREHIEDLRKMVASDEHLSPEIKQRAAALPSQYEEYYTALMDVVGQAISEEGITPQEANTRMTPHKKAIHDLETNIDEIALAAAGMLDETGATTEEKVQSSIRLLSILLPILFVVIIILGIFFLRFNAKTQEQKVYYEQILDAIPLPISVTDLDMNWTFINKAVEGMIGIDRNSIYGHQCSEWGADICNTEKCGVAVLRKGLSSSVFRNKDDNKYYKTNVSYIKNRKDEQIGHVETVTDVNVEMNLEKVVGEINQAVSQIASASRQVSDSSQSLSQGATEQAASLEEITSSMAELGSQTKSNAENAGEANRLAQKSQEYAEKGVSQMEEMMASMGGIQASSSEIANIIKVIDDIAFQTNLLALNAAVEAARAGKHGKGFAVVAQDVRNLAGRSAKAAQQTSELITDTVEKVEKGSASAETTVDALIEIVESISHVASLNSEIAAASNEQAQGISQVNEGLNQVDQVTQQNTATAEETASASEELSGMAAQLRQLITRFTSDKQESTSTDQVDAKPSPRPKELTGPQSVNGWDEDSTPSDMGDWGIEPDDSVALNEDDFGEY
jgi:PAS domain-containing protein/uncharacterized protein Yka (UPF0111/DUF47 family)